jgi:hypothetical protein
MEIYICSHITYIYQCIPIYFHAKLHVRNASGALVITVEIET